MCELAVRHWILVGEQLVDPVRSLFFSIVRMLIWLDAPDVDPALWVHPSDLFQEQVCYVFACFTDTL